MNISCECDFYEEEHGSYSFDPEDFDFYKAKEDNSCQSCGCSILKDEIYWQLPIEVCFVKDECDEDCEEQDDCFDFCHKTEFINYCEKCGDLAATIMDQGFCCEWENDIQAQWRKYIDNKD